MRARRVTCIYFSQLDLRAPQGKVNVQYSFLAAATRRAIHYYNIIIGSVVLWWFSSFSAGRANRVDSRFSGRAAEAAAKVRRARSHYRVRVLISPLQGVRGEIGISGYPRGQV